MPPKKGDAKSKKAIVTKLVLHDDDDEESAESDTASSVPVARQPSAEIAVIAQPSTTANEMDIDSSRETFSITDVLVVFLDEPINPVLSSTSSNDIRLELMVHHKTIYHSKIIQNEKLQYTIKTERGYQNTNLMEPYPIIPRGKILVHIVPDIWGTRTFMYNDRRKFSTMKPYLELATGIASLTTLDTFYNFYIENAKSLHEHQASYIRSDDFKVKISDDFIRKCPASPLFISIQFSKVLKKVEPRAVCSYSNITSFIELVDIELVNIIHCDCFDEFIDLIENARLKAILIACYHKNSHEREKAVTHFRRSCNIGNDVTEMELKLMSNSQYSLKLCPTVIVARRLASSMNLAANECDKSTRHVMENLLKNRPDYLQSLCFLKNDSYLGEWKAYLSILNPPETKGELIFSFDRFSHNIETTDSVCIELVQFIDSNISKCVEANGRLDWFKMTIQQISKVKKSMTNGNHQLIDFIDEYVRNVITLQFFFQFIEPVNASDCGKRITRLKNWQERPSVMSEVSKSLLCHESMNVHQFIDRLSDDNRFELLVDYFQKKKCWNYPSYCHFPDPASNRSVFLHIWLYLFKSRAATCDFKAKESFKNLLSNSKSILFEALSLTPCYELVNMLLTADLSENNSHIKTEFVADIQELFSKVDSGQLTCSTMDIFDQLQIFDRLDKVLRKIDHKLDLLQIVSVQKVRINDIKSNWIDTLGALREMETRVKFRQLSSSLLQSYENRYSQLESLPISHWQVPEGLSDNIRWYCELLVKYKRSIIFNYVWDQESIGQNIDVSADTVFIDWIRYIQLYHVEFTSLCESIGNCTIPVDVTNRIFGGIFRINVTDVIKQIEIQQGNDLAMKSELNRRLQDFSQYIVNELREACNQGAKNLVHIEAIAQKIVNCMHASLLKDDSKALENLCGHMQLEGDGILQNRLFSQCQSDMSIDDYLSKFQEVVAVLPSLRQILPSFLVFFYDVVVSKGLLDKVLKKIPNMASLNRRIDAKQSEDLDEETGEALASFRLIGQVFLQQESYSRLFIESGRKSVSEFMNFALSCSECFKIFSTFSRHPKYVLFAEEALETSTEEKQIIAIVKSLLQTGSIVIEVKNRKVTCFGLQSDGTTVPPDEFEALPTQLLLASGVETPSLDSSSIDEPLPENVSRSIDRERYVRKFNLLYDRSVKLAQIIKRLSETGFPDFQENRLTIPSQINIADFDKEIRRNEGILQRWIQSYGNVRREFPATTCFSRAQLVEWMQAFRSNPPNISALYDIFLSVGCSYNRDIFNTLDFICRRNQKSVYNSFQALNEAFRKCFDLSKLSNRGIIANDFSELYNLTKLDEETHEIIRDEALPVRLLRAIGNCVEEIAVGLFIGRHRRIPMPFEIFFCSSNTTDTDIDDFLERWVNYKRIFGQSVNNASCYIIHPNRLGFEQQHRFVTSIRERQQEAEQLLANRYSIALIILVESAATCYITNVFKNYEYILTEGNGVLARSNITLALANQPVFAVRSRSCGSGKTRTIIENLVLPTDELHCQLTIDITSPSGSLKRLSNDRPLSSEIGIVLHFNVGHISVPQVINQFLLEYVVLGAWKDENGTVFPRHPLDTIAVELPNTGYDDERERIPVTFHFKDLTLNPLVSNRQFIPIPVHEFGCDRFSIQNFTKDVIKAVLPYQVDNAPFDYNPTDVYQYDGRLLITLEPFQLKFGYTPKGAIPMNNDVEWLTSDGNSLPYTSGRYVQLNNKLLYKYVREKNNDGIGEKLLVKLHEMIRTGNRVMIDHNLLRRLADPTDHELDSAVRALANENIVVESAREAYVRRFYKIASTQLRNFYFSFQFWELAGANADENGHNEADFMLMLVYYFAMMLIENSKSLSMPTFAPQDMNNYQDDVSRFQNMQRFHVWMGRPYFICTPESFRILSATNIDPFQDVLDKVVDNPRFKEWLLLQQQYLGAHDRKQLQALCDQMAFTPFNPDGLHFPLSVFLQLIGCFDGGIKVIDAIRNVNEKGIPGSQPIYAIEELLVCLDWLNERISKSIAFDDTISKLKVTTEDYFQSIFGGSSHKPPFQLTIGTFLRIIAIQVRNICRIPICIVGETGCGKTEILSFLAKLIGAHFYVINVQEGMNEESFSTQLEVVIQDAVLNPDNRITCVLDEANATSHVWLTKDMLCDGILNGIRLPSNVNFVVIMNPAKSKLLSYQKVEEEMSVGGLDFKLYQHNEHQMSNPVKDLVYQVHISPETLYSLAWDFGNSADTHSNMKELPVVEALVALDIRQESCSDELQLALGMINWLVNKLKDNQGLTDAFQYFGSVDGDAHYWRPFRTILLELILASQRFIRLVFGGESSTVSLREIKNVCHTISVVNDEFYGAAIRLKPDLVRQGPVAYFKMLGNSINCALIRTYCLRLDNRRRNQYVVEMHRCWDMARRRFYNLEESFLPSPTVSPTSFEESELYRSFDELATLVVSDLLIQRDIAPNQALKENILSILLAIWMKSTLFVIGRPGSTKSRALELLCETSTVGRQDNTFLAELGLVIHKFVVQCSPDTTAEHVNSQARRAAIAQSKQQNLPGERHQCILVLEEVGATIGSRHNPLMSLHQLIDHGVQCVIRGQPTLVHIPIIGISNYRLDSSKMNRGYVVHRGNPSVDDLALTARTILRSIDRDGSTEYTRLFSRAFCHNVLQDENLTWYHGMRDFYASISTIQRLNLSTKEFSERNRSNKTPQLSAHVVRWAIIINMQGFPDHNSESRLLDTMTDSFELRRDTPAVWEWKNTSSEGTNTKLCDVCCRMQYYVKLQQYRSEYPNEVIDTRKMTAIFKQHASPMTSRNIPCEYFNNLKYIPAVEVIAYSLWETTSRHQMIFTKANAALSLLFSLKILRREACTIIFYSAKNKDGTVSTTELVQQMMRIKACLREGKTLILVRARHLYEALLHAIDMPTHNAHNVEADGDIFIRTMLSMAGVTQSVLARPSFRCIILEDRDELKKYVMPPVINRFAKATLTYSSILSPSKRNIREYLGSYDKIQISIEEDVKIFHIVQSLAPGVDSVTLDSAAYLYSTEQEALERIIYMISAKNYRRLQLGLVESFHHADIKTKLIEIGTKRIEIQAFDSFEDSAVRLLQITDSFYNDSEEMVEENNDSEANIVDSEGICIRASEMISHHLMVLTEQLQVDVSDLITAISNIVMNADETDRAILVSNEVQLLNEMTSSGVIQSLLHLQKESLEKNESAYSLFVLDSESPSQISIETFIYLVSSIRDIGIDRRRVILIVTYKDTLSTDQKIQFTYQDRWVVLNVDEAVTHSIGMNSDSSLKQLDRDDIYLHELLTENLFCDLILQEDLLTWLCQNIDNSTDVSRRVNAVRNLLLSSTALKKAVTRICLNSIEEERISFQRWAVLAFRKAKHSSDSLRSIYINYLGSFAVRVIHSVLVVLFRYGTIYVIGDLDDFVAKVLPGMVPSIDVSKCLLIQTLPETNNSDLLSELIRFSNSVNVSFPFLPQISVVLSQSPFNQFTQQVIDCLESVPNHYVLVYLRDLFCKGYNVDASHVDLLLRLLEMIDSKCLLSIPSFHLFCCDHKSLITAVRQFVACGLECFPAEQFIMKDFPSKFDALALTLNFSGIPMIVRLELLRIILQNDEEIPWKVYRAAGLALQMFHDIENIQPVIHRALELFVKNIGEGIYFTLTTNPALTKIFLFELFDGMTNDDSRDDLLEAMKILCNLNLPLDDTITCCTNFIISNVLELFVKTGDPAMVNVLSWFCEEKEKRELLSHSLVNIFLSDFKSIFQCWELLQLTVHKESNLDITFSSTICVVCVWNLLKHNDIGDTVIESMIAILEKIFERFDFKRDATLFAVRQLSSGGATGLDVAIRSLQSIYCVPIAIRDHPVIMEVLQSLQVLSPLSLLPSYKETIKALDDKAQNDLNRSEDHLRIQPPNVHTIAVASILLNVAPKVIDNFNAIKQDEYNRFGFQGLLSLLEASSMNRNLPNNVSIRELILHGIALILSNNLHIKLVLQACQQSIRQREALKECRKRIEEALVAECPRCKGAIGGWDGCFSVTCQCGCVFCGVCLIDCNGDAHDHCQRVHGSYWLPFDRFIQEFGARVTQLIRGIVNQNPHLHESLSEELPRILQGNRYGVRAETILAPRVNRVEGVRNNNLISPSIRYLYDLFNLLSHSYLRLTGEPEALSWEVISESIDKTISDLNQTLFPGTNNLENTFWWAHAAMSELYRNNSQPLASIVDSQRYAEALIAQIAPDVFVRKAVERCRPNEQILDEIGLKETFLETVSPDRMEYCNLFQYRSKYSVELLREYVHVNALEFPLLCHLMDREKCLSQDNINTNFRILQYLQDISQHARSIKLSLTKAEQTSFDDFVKTNALLFNRKNQFEIDFKKIFPLIHWWECNDQIQALYGDVMNDFGNAAIVSFLSNRTTGILAKSFYEGKEGNQATDWTGLARVQNDIFSLINPNLRDAEKISLYELSLDDIVSCDINSLIHVVYKLFLVSGFTPKLSEDIQSIETMIKYGRLRMAFYRQLQCELPDHKYPMNGFVELLNPLSDALYRRGKSFECLPSRLFSALSLLFAQAADIIEELFSFTIVAIRQLISQLHLPELVRDIQFTIPLTRDQQRGQQILLQVPIIRNELQVKHLRSLLGMCWDETMDASADASLEYIDESGFISIASNPECHAMIPRIMDSMRVFGLAYCQQPFDRGFARTSIQDNLVGIDLLDGDMVNNLEVLLDRHGIQPLIYPSRHFGPIYRAAKFILGHLEVVSSEGGTEKEEIHIVSSSVMRQFLANPDPVQSSSITRSGRSQVDTRASENIPEIRGSRKESETIAKNVENRTEATVVWSNPISDFDF